MPHLSRLDAELVRRGLARSREHAGRLILEGRVSAGGTVATKPATRVSTDAPLVVVELNRLDYASRGGHKLAGALDTLASSGLEVVGRRCLDAGASTGGFTDVLLRRNAAQVVAVDVGYGQLDWRLRQDDRVVILDRTNVRDLTLERIDGPVDLVVADLSFISLRVVLPALLSVCQRDGDLLLMVKPQFEVGRGVAKKGVVRDPDQRLEAIVGVATAAEGYGWGTRAVVASTLTGPAGNVEYFIWLRRDCGPIDRAAARAAVMAGPTGERLAP
ncbi:MAG: TlyA family RNA methyltransferase [Nocardioidaceae bacterium]